jgi:hypothetical protein
MNAPRLIELMGIDNKKDLKKQVKDIVDNKIAELKKQK